MCDSANKCIFLTTISVRIVNLCTHRQKKQLWKKKTVQGNMQYKWHKKVLILTNLHDTGMRHTGVTIEGEGKNRQRVKQDKRTELVDETITPPSGWC